MFAPQFLRGLLKFDCRYCSSIQQKALISITLQKKQNNTNPRLVEVGKLQTPKVQGKYESGQLFLHQVFGYRGIVLFPWVAKVYDRDDAKSLTYPSGRHGRDVIGKTHTYYQALIDTRDCPYINAQSESVTFLGMPDSGGSLYAIPGLDYVSHEDVVPYNTYDTQPIQNELFEKFFTYDNTAEPCWSADETLKSWQKQNHPWLELSEVHRQTTNDIRVTVTPFYMGTRLTSSFIHSHLPPWIANSHKLLIKLNLRSWAFNGIKIHIHDRDPLKIREWHSSYAEESHSNQVYWWRYCIRLENLGKDKVQLRERHWRIFSLSGTLETVRGRGVVGKEPILSPKEPAFQYSSHVSLQAPSGHMWGTFKMEKEDGSVFECKIPPFSLESKVYYKQSAGIGLTAYSLEGSVVAGARLDSAGLGISNLVMYVIVKFGVDKEVVFNPDCRTVSLLDEIKCKCNIEPWAEIELSDQNGNPKDLREHLHRYASEFLTDKESYVLLLVESKAKGIKYTPLIENNEILSAEFLERLESKQQQRSKSKNGKYEKRVSSNKSTKTSARKTQSRQSIRSSTEK